MLDKSWNASAENQTPGRWVQSENAFHCAIRPPWLIWKLVSLFFFPNRTKLRSPAFNSSLVVPIRRASVSQGVSFFSSRFNSSLCLFSLVLILVNEVRLSISYILGILNLFKCYFLYCWLYFYSCGFYNLYFVCTLCF